MGGTGMPDPTQAYIDEVNDFFLQPNFPGYEPVGLQTPEEAFPIYGLLTGYTSVTEGVADLNYAITHTYAGDNLVIFGVSQSAMIASLEEQQLAANTPADLGQLHFGLLAGPDNPMGGLFERFAGLDNPAVNYDLYPPSPTDLFPTDIYTGEYDGVSDFPDDLSNLLSVANAIAGTQYVHLGYSDLTMEQVQSAVLLGQSGQTDFYMIPTTVLPILQSLYSSSESGKELADFLQPDLQVIVNMGYGNLDHGLVADPGGIDGAVGVGFFDKVDPLAVEAALQLGQVQGIVDATDDYLSSQGEAPLPDFVTTVLDSTSGYDLTSWLDSELIAGLTQLSTLPGNADLNPAVLFDGLPLISGTSFIDGLNQYLTEFYTQIMGAL
jgi:PE-PPE domain